MKEVLVRFSTREALEILRLIDRAYQKTDDRPAARLLLGAAKRIHAAHSDRTRTDSTRQKARQLASAIYSAHRSVLYADRLMTAARNRLIAIAKENSP